MLTSLERFDDDGVSRCLYADGEDGVCIDERDGVGEDALGLGDSA